MKTRKLQIRLTPAQGRLNTSGAVVGAASGALETCAGLWGRGPSPPLAWSP